MKRDAGALTTAAIAALALMSASAQAAGTSTPGGGGGILIRGSAPLPQFQLDFPTTLGALPGMPLASSGGLEVSLSAPGSGGVLSFVFSPRSQFGFAQDKETGTSRGYAGLSWTVFDAAGIFGNLGFAGSLTQPGAEETMSRRALGPPLALHETIELGYELGGPHSLSLSLDHASAPDLLGDRSERNDLRLRYGLRF